MIKQALVKLFGKMFSNDSGYNIIIYELFQGPALDLLQFLKENDALTKESRGDRGCWEGCALRGVVRADGGTGRGGGAPVGGEVAEV